MNDLPPQQSPPGDPMRPEPTGRQDDGGCMAALLILMGIPLVLLGAFVGSCAVVASAPLLLLIGLVAVGLGIWFFTLAGKLHHRPTTTRETGNGGSTP